jgi:chemotaxis protein methyltransferase CheR
MDKETGEIIRAVQKMKLMPLQRYFDLGCGIYGILPRLRDHINFSVFDLLDPFSNSPTESIYGDIDIVFCCSVLFFLTMKGALYAGQAD